jgi:hypothetical protein
MTDRPPPLMVSEPGSFAEYTVSRRMPRIVNDVMAGNIYPPDIVGELARLRDALPDGPVAPPLADAPDAAFWRRAWDPWAGATWRHLPWFFAETYFYRRLLETVRYFQDGPQQGADPFAPPKRAALVDGLPELEDFVEALPAATTREERFSLWVHRALWGNRADLSNVAVSGGTFEAVTREGVLIDHTAEVWHMLRNGIRRADVVADNAGPELLVDLGLIAFLLEEGLARRVHLHLKPHPFFVSDATLPDLLATLAALQGSPRPTLRHVATRLRSAVADGRLVPHDHPFWTRCLFYTQLPQDLRDTLAQADLLILKGDLNYRRLLEDRHWPPTTDLATVTPFMPAPFVTLRTLKSEVMVGLSPGRAEALAAEDPNWLIDGERGVIHLVRRVGA